MRHSPRVGLLLFLLAAAAGLAGCVPKVAPAEYYAAMRHSQGPVSEEKTPSLVTLEYHPADGGKPRRIAAGREALAQYRRDHPDEVRDARDYVKGMKDGRTLGLLGLDLQAARAEAPPEDPPPQPTPWEEGLYVGNPEGLLARAPLVLLFENRREIGRSIEDGVKDIRDRAAKAANRALVRAMDSALDKALGKPKHHKEPRIPPPEVPPWAREDDYLHKFDERRE